MLGENDKNAIVDRLMRIVTRQSVEDEVTADKNSIAAAKFMIGLQAKYLKLAVDDADIVRLNENDQKAIVERLMQILSKRSVIVQTKNGPVEDHVIADKNAITSASLLVTLHDQWLKRPGTPDTAGSCASHDADTVGSCMSHDVDTAGSCASHDGFKIGKSFARCEPDEVSSDADFTVHDVIQEAIGSAGVGGRRAVEQENRRAVDLGARGRRRRGKQPIAYRDKEEACS